MSRRWPAPAQAPSRATAGSPLARWRQPISSRHAAFVQRELAGLVRADDASARLIATLRIFLEEGASHSPRLKTAGHPREHRALQDQTGGGAAGTERRGAHTRAPGCPRASQRRRPRLRRRHLFAASFSDAARLTPACAGRCRRVRPRIPAWGYLELSRDRPHRENAVSKKTSEKVSWFEPRLNVRTPGVDHRSQTQVSSTTPPRSESSRASSFSDAQASADELRGPLTGAFAKWQLPEPIEVVDAIPRTATGKWKKTELREQFAGGAASAAGTGHRPGRTAEGICCIPTNPWLLASSNMHAPPATLT